MKKLYVICITMLISLIFCNNVYALDINKNAGEVFKDVADHYNKHGKIEGVKCIDPSDKSPNGQTPKEVPNERTYTQLKNILEVEKERVVSSIDKELSNQYDNLIKLISQEEQGIDTNNTEYDSSGKKFEEYTSQEIVDYIFEYGTASFTDDLKEKWKTKLENETGELELHGKDTEWYINNYLVNPETEEEVKENDKETKEDDKETKDDEKEYTISGTVIRPGGSSVNGSDITSPADNPEDYRPGEMGDNATLVRLGGIITGGLKIVGIIASVLILVILGIKYMTGTIQEKAEYKKTMIPYIVGAVFLGAGGVLIELIFNLVSGLTF